MAIFWPRNGYLPPPPHPLSLLHPVLSWFRLHRALSSLLLWKPTFFKRHHSQEAWCPLTNPSYYHFSLHSPTGLSPPDNVILFPLNSQIVFLYLSWNIYSAFLPCLLPERNQGRILCFSYFHISMKTLGCKFPEVRGYISSSLHIPPLPHWPFLVGLKYLLNWRELISPYFRGSWKREWGPHGCQIKYRIPC